MYQITIKWSIKQYSPAVQGCWVRNPLPPWHTLHSASTTLSNFCRPPTAGMFTNATFEKKVSAVWLIVSSSLYRLWGWSIMMIDSGSIQEDRHKVEQFHFLWNSSTKSGTVPQFVGQCPKIIMHYVWQLLTNILAWL